MKRRVVNPKLLYKLTDIEAMKGGPFVERFCSGISTRPPNVYVGPSTTGGVNSGMGVMFEADGNVARDLALAWRLTGETAYAERCATYLRTWSTYNTPTDYATCGDKWGGSYQAHGAFTFAHAYDLIRGSLILSPEQEWHTIEWFAALCSAQESYLRKAASEWVMTHDNFVQPYQWTGDRDYFVYETYAGGDNVALTMISLYALTKVMGMTDENLHDPERPQSLPAIISAATTPRNDGDGIVEPAPALYVYALPTPGRGGTIDYCTYNARAQTILYEMAARHLDIAIADKLRTTWRYLEKFFDGSRAPFAPGDEINLTACLPRFRHAASVLDLELPWLAEQWYYEPQFLGPVSVTCWRP
jgi:hypothetical protein